MMKEYPNSALDSMLTKNDAAVIYDGFIASHIFADNQQKYDSNEER